MGVKWIPRIFYTAANSYTQLLRLHIAHLMFYIFLGFRHTIGRDIYLDSDGDDLTDDEDYDLPPKGVTIDEKESDDISNENEDDESIAQDAKETIYLEGDFEYENLQQLKL